MIARLLSSPLAEVPAKVDVFAGTYGRAQLPPVAEGAGAVVVADVSAGVAVAAAGFGFGGGGAATLAFIQEYFWLRPAA